MSDPLDAVFGDKQRRQEALKTISEAIDPAGHDGLIEIEILGRNMFPPGAVVLRDGPAVAVNKDGLAAAYYEVLQNMEGLGPSKNCEEPPLHTDSVAGKLKSLAVLVLLQPEFLLAVNLRKSL